jgi:hypothetical protein
MGQVMHYFTADHRFFDYMGRIDLSDKYAPRFFYAGSMVRLRFTGTSFSAVLNRMDMWGTQFVTAIIDGKVYTQKSDLADNGLDTVITFADNLEPGIHTAAVIKRQEAPERFTFRGVIVDRMLPPNFNETLRLEVFGDSVCAGELTEAEGFEGTDDPEWSNAAFDNVLHSFVMMTAQNLNARIHNNSQGGIALLDGTGWFHIPDLIGLESTYDKMCYVPEQGEVTKWDFTRYTPDFVIIEVAQNDQGSPNAEPGTLTLSDPAHKARWTGKYMEIVKDLHSQYKTSKFIFTTTVLNHNAEWDEALVEMADKLTAEGIPCYKNTFTDNGCGTPGHPRTSEQKKMAEELTAFIQNLI